MLVWSAASTKRAQTKAVMQISPFDHSRTSLFIGAKMDLSYLWTRSSPNTGPSRFVATAPPEMFVDGSRMKTLMLTLTPALKQTLKCRRMYHFHEILIYLTLIILVFYSEQDSEGDDEREDEDVRVVTLSQILAVNVHHIKDSRQRTFALDRYDIPLLQADVA